MEIHVPFNTAMHFHFIKYSQQIELSCLPKCILCYCQCQTGSMETVCSSKNSSISKDDERLDMCKILSKTDKQRNKQVHGDRLHPDALVCLDESRI